MKSLSLPSTLPRLPMVLCQIHSQKGFIFFHQVKSQFIYCHANKLKSVIAKWSHKSKQCDSSPSHWLNKRTLMVITNCLRPVRTFNYTLVYRLNNASVCQMNIGLRYIIQIYADWNMTVDLYCNQRTVQVTASCRYGGTLHKV